MKNKIFFLILTLCLLIPFISFADETQRWSSGSTNVTTAQTFTAKFDINNNGDGAGETQKYIIWTVENLIETTDAVFCDADSHDVAGTMTQNVAVNDASRSTSIKIPAGSWYTFVLKAARSTVSCVCAAGQTCSGVQVIASETK